MSKVYVAAPSAPRVAIAVDVGAEPPLMTSTLLLRRCFSSDAPCVSSA